VVDKTIYTVGGTVQAGGGTYVRRKADDELLNLCRSSEFAFVLSPRQLGKSSLMVGTSRQLENEGIRTAIVDLSSIGTAISSDEWYLGIVNEIANTLELETDVFSWWESYDQLGYTQRLTKFFREVLLQERNEQIVLFFDEIDSTLSIPFSDDFFASIRAMYNARSRNISFTRLSFVLIGVATPGDLIADSKRTPFNIGQRVDLSDFNAEEALSLTQGLEGNPEDIASWILEWTGGHPYLTQRVCAFLSSRNEPLTKKLVQNAVEKLFEGDEERKENNLLFVRDMLTKRAPDEQVLKTYKDIRSGKSVKDDERSIPKAHLKISGVVKRDGERLVLRNRIYEKTFDLSWVKENTKYSPLTLFTTSSFIYPVIIIFACVLVLVLPLFLTSPGAGVQTVIDPSAVALVFSPRPSDAELEGKEVVSIGVYILSIGNYDISSGKYSMDFFLNFSCETTQCDPSGFEIVNADGETFIVDQSDLLESGDYYYYRVKANLKTYVDIRSYPFDSHTLNIEIEDQNKTSDEYILVPDPDQSGIDSSVFVPGWDLEPSMGGTVSAHNYEIYAESYSRTRFSVRIGHPWMTSFKRLLIPIVIGLICMLTLVLDESHLYLRVALATGTFICELLYHGVATVSIPLVPYLTYFFNFMMLQYFFITMIIFIAFVMIFLGFHQSNDGEKRIIINIIHRLEQRVVPTFWVLSMILMHVTSLG